MPTASKIDRRRGALIGLAVGDALGAAVEFQVRGTFEPVTDFRAGGPHVLEAGEWTDDTSMALALADSIAEVGWDLEDQAERYVAWWREAKYSSNGTVFDIGMTVLTSLQTYLETGDARSSGNPDELASGNGSIMRLAPVPIRYMHMFPARLADLVGRAVESSLPTHRSPQCLASCAYLAVVLAGLIHGLPRDTVLDPGWEQLDRLRQVMPLHPEVDAIAAGSFREKQLREVVGSGYVVHCLEAALWAFHDADDFESAVLRAVNLGDDADTTGAVCGQLAGACWGESGIPERWRTGLARRERIDEILRRLLGSAA